LLTTQHGRGATLLARHDEEEIMADRNEKYRQKARDLCQPHLEEQILAVGQFQPKGSLGAGAMMFGVSGAAGLSMRAAAKKNAGGLPHIGLYALTPTSLHVFDAKPKGFGWKVKKLVASIPRDQFTASRGQGKMTDQVTLLLTDGEQISLESMTMGAQGFNDDIIDQLVGSA
jgi:hypothetical protein